MRKSFAIILLISLSACQGISQSSEAKEGTAYLVIETIGNTTKEKFERVGYSAIEMLRENHEVKLSYSNSVKCIDSVCAESGYWWPFYVNGKKAALGPQSYVVRNNDTIMFKISRK